MSTLVACLDDALCAFDATHPPRPTLWFGHSSGARVAFELARRRHAAGRPLPGHLVVSGAPAPDIVRTTPTLHRIADDVTFLRAVADAYGGVPADVLAHEELRALVIPTLRADLRLHERYVYVDAPPLPIPLLAVGGESDPAVPDVWLQQWARHTTGGFRCERYPGHHFYLHDPVVRSALLRTLRAIRM